MSFHNGIAYRSIVTVCAVGLLSLSAVAQESAGGGGMPTVKKTGGRQAMKESNPGGEQNSIPDFVDESAQPGAKKKPPIPPTFPNVKYGPYDTTVLDLWLAKSDKPTPVLVSIHGGGFQKGDKSQFHAALFDLCLKSGISFASVDYRLTNEAQYPAPFLDCARAIQFLRSNAKLYNLDKARFACVGSSAGAGISVWLAFHDDLADPKNGDPVLRESTRLNCAVVSMMQCAYDPREIRKIVPGKAYDAGFIKLLFGLPKTWNWDTDKVDAALDARLKDCSAITHLTKDAAPIFSVHRQIDNKPDNIHNAAFGKYLKEQMDKVGVECVTRMDSDYKPGAGGWPKEQFAFLKKHFGMQ
jgi:acetyl esterase